jgi:hypothetical protein
MRTHARAQGLRLRGTRAHLLAAAVATATAALAGATSAQAAGNCGVRVDLPHASYTTAHQIHTRAESFCWVLPVQSNQISAVTYRSRWYGWQRVGSAAYGPVARQSIRVTVAVNCVAGTWHRYRTEARGVAVIAGRTYTAAAYEQNDDEIRCN